MPADRGGPFPGKTVVGFRPSMLSGRRGISRRTLLLWAGGAVGAAVLLAGFGSSRSTAAPRAVGLATGWSWQPQPVPLCLGVTHTQYSLDSFDPATAREHGESVLRAAAIYQNQHLMAFGVLNPEPSPGVYDWGRLDERMALIARTGGRTVLTMAVAPDWMKGGQAGQTDYSKIDVAPLPEHYEDFAELCATAVRRYPQIQRVQVWNEFKGFYDAKLNDWDSDVYTTFYNLVYAAVKQARPDVLVGGPYIPIDSWADPGAAGHPSELRGAWGTIDQRSLDALEYWLAHAQGADFVAIDGGDGTRDRGLFCAPVAAVEKFAVVTGWLRDRTKLPVWWAEFYPGILDNAGSTTAERAAATLEAVAAFAESGVSAALLWQPQSDGSFPYSALWTSVSDPDGGTSTALTAPWTWLVPRLARGEVAIGHSSDARVVGFRAGDGTLLLNTTGSSILVDAEPQPFVLPPWGIRTVPTGVAAAGARSR